MNILENLGQLEELVTGRSERKAEAAEAAAAQADHEAWRDEVTENLIRILGWVA